MKKKFILIIMMCFMITSFYSLLQVTTAKAEEINNGTGNVPGTVTAALVSINIQQNPSKTTYSKGENLNLTDMILQANYVDGTTGVITDYVVTGYHSNVLGYQTILISYQGFSVNVGVTVIPAKVTNVSVISYNTNSVSFKWDVVPGASRYEVYSFDSLSGTYILSASSEFNSITLNYPSATAQSIQICAVENYGGLEYRGTFSDSVVAATAPNPVTGLNVAGTTDTTISLTWNAVPGASGYIVYRANAAGEFVVCKLTSSNSFMNKNLSSGKGYQYKVCAYTYSEKFSGVFSGIVDTSTNPAQMVLKCKAGEQKIRITWNKITGASFYDIYIGDEVSGYTLATSRKASSACSYTIEGLTTGNSYTIYAIARRFYTGTEYISKTSEASLVQVADVAATSSEAKLFATEQELQASMSYTDIKFFNKYVKLSKSFIIPGMVSTNAGGFTSTKMCPQGITFAGNYMLQTAYDIMKEENSVIYVIDKKTKTLLTTLVLPSKAHLGGIAFDGVNVWVTRGTNVSSIPYTQIQTAVELNSPYYNIKFGSTSILKITASYLTYYNDKLWAGTYNELQNTSMYSYTIENKDTAPSLTLADKINVPTRVQGASFTTDGTLILSRSCQQYKGLRGYMRQLDLYKPDYSKKVNGVIPLGQLVNSVEMPSMNEGIVIDGSYLYVTFESVAFEKASYQMDRICAFKLSSLTKKVS